MENNGGGSTCFAEALTKNAFVSERPLAGTFLPRDSENDGESGVHAADGPGTPEGLAVMQDRPLTLTLPPSGGMYAKCRSFVPARRRPYMDISSSSFDLASLSTSLTN